MHRILAFFLVILLALFAVYAAIWLAPRLAPDVEVEEEPEAAPDPPPVVAEDPRPASLRFDSFRHDFGRKLQGDEAEHRFEFRVVGEDEVLIENLGASCGCVHSELQVLRDGEWIAYEMGTPLAPGTVGGVLARVETSARNAREDSHLSLYSNDAAVRRLKLHLHVDLVKLFALEPERIVARDVLRRTGIVSTVRVTPLEAPDVEITRVGPIPPEWSVDLAHAPDRSWVDVTVRARPAEDAKQLRGQILLFAQTSAAEGARPVYLQVLAGLSPAVRCEPRIIVFDRVTEGEEHRFGVSFESSDPEQALQIEDVRIADDEVGGLETELTVVEPGRRYRIDVVITGQRPTGHVRGKLLVFHDLQADPHKIQIAGLVVPRDE